MADNQSKGFLILGILVVFFVIAIIVVAIVVMIKKDDKEEEVTPASSKDSLCPGILIYDKEDEDGNIVCKLPDDIWKETGNTFVSGNKLRIKAKNPTANTCYGKNDAISHWKELTGYEDESGNIAVYKGGLDDNGKSQFYASDCSQMGDDNCWNTHVTAIDFDDEEDYTIDNLISARTIGGCAQNNLNSFTFA